MVSSRLRHLHRPAGRPVPGLWVADGAAGQARARRPLRIQPQHPEAAERRGRKRRSGRGEALLRGLSVLQPDPAPEEGGPCRGGEDRGPAGHHRLQGDPLHLQRHLPLHATGQEIAGAPPGGDKDWFVPRLLDSKGGGELEVSLVRRERPQISSYAIVIITYPFTRQRKEQAVVSNIFDSCASFLAYLP